MNELLTAEKVWIAGAVCVCLILTAQQLYYHYSTNWDKYFGRRIKAQRNKEI